MSNRPLNITTHNFYQFNWTVDQLRLFAKFLHVPSSGKKDELLFRIRQHLGPAKNSVSTSAVSSPSIVPAVVNSSPKTTPQVPKITLVSTNNPCHQYCQNALQAAEIQQKRQLIYQQIAPLGNVSTMTDQHLGYLFQVYDYLFFQNRIGTAQSPTVIFRFEFGRGTSTAGYCKRVQRNTVCTYTISIARPVFAKAFSETGAIETVNGLQCRNQLEALQLVFEHELAHLIVYLWCYEEMHAGVKRQVHGALFQTLARNLFGHTDFRHYIGKGLDEDPATRRTKVNAVLTPGQTVQINSRGQVVSFKVVKLNDRSNAKTFLGLGTDGKQYRVPLTSVVIGGDHDTEESDDC